MAFSKNIVVALSGGGYRASLFGLGVLLYLVDSGLNDHVTEICSVSGGSITNGIVAHECDFSRTKIPEFDRVAEKLISSILKGGIFSRSSIPVALYFAIAFGVALTLLALWYITLQLVSSSAFGAGYPVLAIRVVDAVFTLTAVFILGTLALLRGVVVSYVLGSSLLSEGAKRRTKLGDRKTRNVGHVFCATDLIAATPFYFFTGYGRAVLRSYKYGWTDADDIALHTAVRASAAFPGGIPPKHLPLRGRRWGQPDSGHRRVGPALGYSWQLTENIPKGTYLADGGVWNNLGTQWFEDWENRKVPLPNVEENLELPHRDYLLVVDSSRPLGQIKPCLLWIPVVAEVVGLVRSMDIIYLNTVTPRVTALLEAVSGSLRSVPMVVSLGDAPLVGAANWVAQPTRSDRVDFEKGRLSKQQFDTLSEQRQERRREFRHKLPETLFPSLVNFPKTRDLYSKNVEVSTTLSPLDKPTVLGLLAQGYLASMEAFYVNLGALDAPIEFPTEDRFSRLCNS